jgi:transcriptional repressor NF-X1
MSDDGRCFCGSASDPKPRFATPHSCGNSCSRERTCHHSCPLPCHPGPCPPCQIQVERPCHCGSNLLSFKCAQQRDAHLSCGNVCGKTLDCEIHACQKICHDGPCEGCELREDAKCFCGKTQKSLKCGEGVKDQCALASGENWIGRFKCERDCGRRVSSIFMNTYF